MRQEELFPVFSYMAVRKEKSSLLMLLPAGSYQESLNLFLAVWIYAARQGLLQLSALPGY